MVTRPKRVAGIAGCTPVEEEPEALVSSARLRVWMSREGLAMPEELDVPLCAPVGAGVMPPPSPLPHTPPCGWTGRVLCDTCVWLPVPGGVLVCWLFPGCFVDVHFISYLQQRRCCPTNEICPSPENGQIFFLDSFSLLHQSISHWFTRSRQVNYCKVIFLIPNIQLWIEEWREKGFANLNQSIPVFQRSFGRREHPTASWCGWAHSSPHIPRW